jgi:N-acetyl-1-D-myo-inositol-2-amino-2-deoxy-alpha-D-glucopyranoside deacetylase
MSQLSLLTVMAHPDDESITSGGRLASYAGEGVRTTLVTATRGEVGEILDKDLDPKEAAPRLGSIREAELRRASQILGVHELVFLDYEDSGMAGLPRNRQPGTFWQADEEEAVGRLISVIRRVRPQVIITDNEVGGYGHPDHIKAHRVTVLAVFYGKDLKRFPGGDPWQPSKLYYTAFPRSAIKAWRQAMKAAGMDESLGEDEEPQFGVPDDRVSASIDVSRFVETKIAAMQAHRTQIPPDSWFMKLRELMGPRAWGREYFERARSRVEAPVPEDDLFAGLR